MAEEKVTRKLTTILAADVEGYSRLMRLDEEATLRTLGEYREIFDGLIARHDGRVFSTGGDSVLAEFGSAVEAVRCAISCQEEISSRNAELADDRKLMFRIGINVGDVMVRDGDLYGDGVNVAARLEGLAEPGGVCISGSVFEQIKHKLSLGFEDIGQQEVKNIAEPVSAYRLVPGQVSVSAAATAAAKPSGARRWRMPAVAAAVAAGLVVLIAAVGLVVWQPWVQWEEPARTDKMAFELPEKPSIAVLPFVNLSGDPGQDHVADGLTETIITTLSKLDEMFVIARNSTFVYKGKSVKVQKVAEELGVRFVLEGSVQKADERVRITAQLIDALTGRHIWSEQYNRAAKDFFAVQDDITLKIADALQVELTEGESAQLDRGGTKNLEAWSNLVRADGLFRRFTKEDMVKAEELSLKAAELDPNWSIPLGELGAIHLIYASFGWSDDRAMSLQRATEFLQKALALDESNSVAYAVLGQVYSLKGEHEKAIALSEKAIAMQPGSSMNLAIGSSIMNYGGQPEEAIPLIKKAMRLSPYYPPWYPSMLALGYLQTGRLEEMIRVGEEEVQREAGSMTMRAHERLVFAYTELGRHDQAKVHVAKVLELTPDYSLASREALTLQKYKDQVFWKKFFNVLRKTGLPD